MLKLNVILLVCDFEIVIFDWYVYGFDLCDLFVINLVVGLVELVVGCEVVCYVLVVNEVLGYIVDIVGVICFLFVL